MRLPLVTIADAPTSDKLLARGDVKVSRVQIAKQGKFKDPRYGEFEITQADFDKWIENFTKLDRTDGRLGLAGDEDHSPEKKGETKATGWITQMDQMGKDGETSTPTELWATVEWTPLGVELIEGRIYAYISPSYTANYQDEEGKSHGTKLMGWGLTNRPFLRMAAVTLSTDPSAQYMAANEVNAPKRDTPAVNPKVKKLLDQLRAKGVTLAEDATEDQILEAAAEHLSSPDPKPSGDAKTLAQQLAAEGMMVTSLAEHTKLVADAAAGAEAAKTLHEQGFENAWNQALHHPDGPKVVPTLKDQYKVFYEANAEGCIKMLSELPSLAPSTPRGSAGTKAELPEGTTLSEDTQADLDDEPEADDERIKIEAKAHQLMQANDSLEYFDAIERAASELGVTL